MSRIARQSLILAASADFPKFVIQRLRPLTGTSEAIGTSNFIILVPHFYLTGLKEVATGGAGPSDGRY